MNITFRQLRLFLALAETGSVSAAAKVMHVTQPTASMQLREVTQAVGVPLYEVVSRRVYLTEAGQALARTARAIAGEWDAFEQSISGAKGLTSGRLKVAVVSTAKYFVPRLLGSFCKLHPQIDISLEVLNRDHVITRLRANQDDLYVMSMPPGDLPLEDQILMPNPLVVIAAAGHRLAARKRVTLAQLQGERFILREKGSGTRMATDAHLRQLGFTPSAVLELGSNEAIKESVEGQLGVSIVSRHALGPHWDGLAILNVQGFPIQSQWHLVWPKGKRLSPIAEVFRGHLIAQAAGVDAGPLTGGRSALGWRGGRLLGGHGLAAGAEDVQLGLVRARLHIHQAQHRVEVVVVRDALLGQFFLQAGCGRARARLHGGREPGDPGHMLLHIGRDGVG
jgi:DNA-binding transcriptional LysR family regulator